MQTLSYTLTILNTGFKIAKALDTGTVLRILNIDIRLDAAERQFV